MNNILTKRVCTFLALLPMATKLTDEAMSSTSILICTPSKDSSAKEEKIRQFYLIHKSASNWAVYFQCLDSGKGRGWILKMSQSHFRFHFA